MKKISLFVLASVALFMMSCNKENAVATPSVVHASHANVSEMIVGNWQLKDYGTVTSSGGNNDESAYKNSCGYGLTNTVVSWSPLVDEVKVNFSEKGDFTKTINTKSTCLGTYKVSPSDIIVQADCSGGQFGIHDFSKKEFVVGDGIRLYRYEKVEGE
jgi:hypothetical protein